jgi:hypothetical protein
MCKDILDYIVQDDENEGQVFSKLRPVDYTLNRSGSMEIPGCEGLVIMLEFEIIELFS